jgi:hypothetical protein
LAEQYAIREQHFQTQVFYHHHHIIFNHFFQYFMQIKAKDLEHQLLEAKLKQQMNINIMEAAKNQQQMSSYEQQIGSLNKTEKELRSQVNRIIIIIENGNRFLCHSIACPVCRKIRAISRDANEEQRCIQYIQEGDGKGIFCITLFLCFDIKEKMSKTIKKNEQENQELKLKCKETDKALIDLADEVLLRNYQCYMID